MKGFSTLKYLCTVFLMVVLFAFCKNEATKRNDIPANVDASTRAENLPLPTQQEKSTSNFVALPTYPMHRDVGEYTPYDEATKDPSLMKFRAQLWKAIQEKNVILLTDLIDENIKIGFGDHNGKKAFIQEWQLYSKPKESKLWNELGSVLKLGGAFGQHSNYQFCAPYISNLEDIQDPFEEGVVIGEGVRVRAHPNSKAKVLKSLSWEKVEILMQVNAQTEVIDGEKHYWQKINTSEDLEGFVYGKFIRTPVDYRAWFEKINDQWKMTAFLAGD